MSAGLTVPRLFNIHCFAAAAAFEAWRRRGREVASGITDKVMHDNGPGATRGASSSKRNPSIHPSTISRLTV